MLLFFFFFQAEDGIRDIGVTGVQTCALPILNPFLIALSVTEDIHRRLMGFFMCALSIIHLATNSPSRPASVAITISFTSCLFICDLTTLNCLPLFFITTDRKSTRLNSSHANISYA